MRPIFASAALLALATSAGAEVSAVVTDMPVVQSLVAEVMGDLGAPEVLVSSGADPHDVQLRPSQARALADADVIFWIGPEMTPWLDGPVAAAAAPAKIALLSAPGTALRQFGEDAAEGEADAANDDDHGGVDPHAWLDPDNARAWLGAIADTLSATDPERAAIYRSNAEAASGAVATLDANLKARTASITGGIVVAHDAYSYAADHYGLAIAGTLASGDAAQPGAARLSSLAALIRSGGVTCVFPEIGRDDKGLAALVEGTPAKLGAPLDPAGMSLSSGRGLYAALLGDLVGKIADCAG